MSGASRGGAGLAMTPSVDDLQRFGLKLLLEPDKQLDVRTLIPVFHRWIQTHAVEGLLVDVADYTHLRDGPLVLLAGHEGNYAIDRSEQRLGLYYYRKQPTAGSLHERLVETARKVIRAGILLETDPSVGDHCRFRSDEIEFVANDRLRAPADEPTAEALRPALDRFACGLFDGLGAPGVRPGQLGDRIRLTLSASGPSDLKRLLSNLR